MRPVRILGAALILASTSFAFSAPATSAPLNVDPGLASAAPASVLNVRYRGGWHRGHGWHRSHGGWRGGRHYGYRRGGGAVLGGLAAGAIIGGAIAASQANAATQGSVAYCEQHYRSYDRASGTYLGYDGDRHACP